MPDIKNNRCVLSVECYSHTKLLVCIDKEGAPAIVIYCPHASKIISVSLRTGHTIGATACNILYRESITEVVNYYTTLGWEFFQLDNEKDLAQWLDNL